MANRSPRVFHQFTVTEGRGRLRRFVVCTGAGQAPIAVARLADFGALALRAALYPVFGEAAPKARDIGRTPDGLCLVAELDPARYGDGPWRLPAYTRVVHVTHLAADGAPAGRMGAPALAEVA